MKLLRWASAVVIAGAVVGIVLVITDGKSYLIRINSDNTAVDVSTGAAMLP